MLSEDVVSEKSFEWLKMMRYHMDIRNVLRAKTEPIETGSQSITAQPEIPIEIKRKTSRARRPSQIAMKARMAAIGKCLKIWQLHVFFNSKAYKHFYQKQCS